MRKGFKSMILRCFKEFSKVKVPIFENKLSDQLMINVNSRLEQWHQQIISFINIATYIIIKYSLIANHSKSFDLKIFEFDRSGYGIISEPLEHNLELKNSSGLGSQNPIVDCGVYRLFTTN
jgi:hypothetical protein